MLNSVVCNARMFIRMNNDPLRKIDVILLSSFLSEQNTRLSPYHRDIFRPLILLKMRFRWIKSILKQSCIIFWIEEKMNFFKNPKIRSEMVLFRNNTFLYAFYSIY